MVLENWRAPLPPPPHPSWPRPWSRPAAAPPPPLLGALPAWPNRLCYMGSCHHVCAPVCMVCVCVFGLSSAWLFQPPAQGTGGNTRLISSSLEPRKCTVWTNTHTYAPHTPETLLQEVVTAHKMTRIKKQKIQKKSQTEVSLKQMLTLLGL